MTQNEKRTTILRIGAVCLVVLLVAISASAQLPTGTILGTVKDPTGAVIAGAMVTVTNTDTGFTRSTTTGADGYYRLPALPVGNYQVEAMHQGFETAKRAGLTLEVAQDAVVDMVLQVGATSQTVTVTAEAPLVDTTSSSVGGIVNEARITDLPLNGRNWTDLTLIQPGISKINLFLGTAASAGYNGTLYSSNGATIRSNMYLLDGADERTMAGFNNTSITNTSLGVDGIKEYKVVSVLPDASYGLAMGSQTTVVSKGGTNQFHGDAFEFLRNSALDARNYFDALDTDNSLGYGTDKSVVYPGARIPPFRRSNFGGALGGPIKKDKTFFYAVYEGIRQEWGQTETKTTVPKACFVNPAGVLESQIPAQILNANSFGTCATGAPSIINVNPVILPLADLFPQPNVVGYPTFNDTFPFIQPVSENYGQFRMDQNFSQSDSLFVRYTQDDANLVNAYTYEPYQVLERSGEQFVTASETHIFSPTLLNTFRFSLSRTTPSVVNSVPASLITPSTQLVSSSLFATIAPQQIALPDFGSISPGGGVTAAGTDVGPDEFAQNIFTWSDDAYWTKGKHALSFGVLIDYFQDFSDAVFAPGGSAAFGSLANFFNADYSTIEEAGLGSNFSRDYHSNTFGFYVQDNYRPLSRLTLNLGLRYEFGTVPQDPNPALNVEVRDTLTDTTATHGAMFLNPSLHNFAPRLGFAWDVFGNGKTSVRGGAGIYYDVGNYGDVAINLATSTPPVSSTLEVINTATTPSVPFAIPLPISTNVPPASPRAVDYHLQQPMMVQRSLTIDQQLPWASALTVSYVGSQGWHLMQVREGDPTVAVGTTANDLPIYGCWNSTLTAYQLANAAGSCPTGFGSSGPRYNPAFGSIPLDQAAGNSYYNSLQVALNKRVTQGLQFQLAYTWSKLLDNGESGTGTEGSNNPWEVPDGYNVADDQGPASFDVASNLRVNVLYHLPNFTSHEYVGKLLNGWWLSSIISAQSGYPFTPSLSVDRALQSGSGEVERPNLDSSFSKATAVTGNPSEWFNPTMFDVPAAGTLGNSGVGILRGPGLENVDFSVVKDTKAAFLGEAGSIEFRAELFNILNHPNFALPVATVWSGTGGTGTAPAGQIGTTADPAFGTVGQISSTVATSRQIEFALKAIF